MKKISISLVVLFSIISLAINAQNQPEVVYYNDEAMKTYPGVAGKYTLDDSQNAKDSKGCGCYNHESGNYNLRRVESLGWRWHIFKGTCANPVPNSNKTVVANTVAYDGPGCNPVHSFPQYFSLNPFGVVSLYPQANFGGAPVELVEGEFDLTSGEYTFFNDKTQSIKIEQGYKIEVYTDWKFQGQSNTYNSDMSSLSGLFNKSISSVKISKATTDKSYISFNGAQQFIEVSGTNLAQGKETRTVYALVKTSQTTIGNIVSWGKRSTHARVGFAVRDGKAAFIGQWADYTGTIKINDDKWHHIAMTYDGNNLKIYVDGQDAGSGVLQLNTMGQNLRIGNISSPDMNEFFQGEIKEISIWNEKLEASEIKNNGISTSKKASFSYKANQPIPGNFNLINMTENNWKK